MTKMTKKQLANLIPNESYQKTVDRTSNVDEYLINSDEQNKELTEVMYKAILQKGFVKINIQRDCFKYQEDIDRAKELIAKNHEERATGDNEVTPIFDTYRHVEGYDEENGDLYDAGFV